MKLSDIDFGAVSRMMNGLSDDERAQLDAMASDMIAGMQSRTEEEEPDVDYTEGLGLDEKYQQLNGRTLDFLEQAWDLEAFYEDSEADFSASVLFLQKALLSELRQADPETRMMSLNQIMARERWQPLRDDLMQIQTALYRAEFDSVTREELQAVKALVLPLLPEVAGLPAAEEKGETE
ncbi:hypothetical protein [uncultured Faecalibaculum sp.]|uniref:hypothetical protein n=1 Tax=uncultured Faecalibaculum sp. TaxID=1729681 RepID=UPI002614BA1A|nr:hypothetical protein [uncultured Faecalibaculum sp.]